MTKMTCWIFPLLIESPLADPKERAEPAIDPDDRRIVVDGAEAPEHAENPRLSASVAMPNKRPEMVPARVMDSAPWPTRARAVRSASSERPARGNYALVHVEAWPQSVET